MFKTNNPYFPQIYHSYEGYFGASHNDKQTYSSKTRPLLKKMTEICIHIWVVQNYIRIHSMQEKYCRYKIKYVIIVNDM